MVLDSRNILIYPCEGTSLLQLIYSSPSKNLNTTILVSRSFQTIVTFHTFSVPWSIFLITKCRVLQSINNLMHRSKPRFSFALRWWARTVSFFLPFRLIVSFAKWTVLPLFKLCPFWDIKYFDDPFLEKKKQCKFC